MLTSCTENPYVQFDEGTEAGKPLLLYTGSGYSSLNAPSAATVIGSALGSGDSSG